MAAAFEQLDAVPGYSVPVHRALTEHILLGGAPRSIAILNGTLAGSRGPRPAPLAGRPRSSGPSGHFAAVWAAKRDPLFRGSRPPSSAHPRSSVGLRSAAP